jgi:DNA-binding FadR family transcriptional regulator
VAGPIQSALRTAPDGGLPRRRDDEPAAAPLRLAQRYEQVAARIAADVAAGRLVPGERLPSERDLARRLGVGRASVREALAALQNEGVLETRPGSGSFVAERARARLRDAALPHDASPTDLLESRALLEPAVARLAAGRAQPDPEAAALLDAMDGILDVQDPGARSAWSDADRRFHRRIAAMTGNPVLLALADVVAARMDEPLWRRLRDESVATPGRTRLHAAEHRMIYEAIVEGDGAAAELYAAQHIRRVRRYMTLDQE